MMQMPQVPVGSTAGQVQVTPQAGTSVNIAILDIKDFPSEVAPTNELFSEFSMMDGTSLFECQGLMKQTGIDLMNCPLTVVLQLRIRRRMKQGPVVLWHVVLPLPLISKHLMNPPHEWETWIGLFPNTQELAAHPAEAMFTQAVHLISRPEYPKLRLRFTYHNPQLQAQALAQQQQEEQESRRRKEQTEQVGRAQFQDIHKLMSAVRSTGANSSASAAAAAAAAASPAPPNAGPVKAVATPVATPSQVDPLRDTHAVAVTIPATLPPGQTANPPVPGQPGSVQPAAPPTTTQPIGQTGARPAQPMPGQPRVAQPTAPVALSQPAGDAGYPIPPATSATAPPSMTAAGHREDALREERLRDALAGSLRFVNDMRVAMVSQAAKLPQGGELPALPPQLDTMEVLAGTQSASSLDSHCQQLKQSLQAILAASSSSQATPKAGADVESTLVEGLRMALMGRLEDADDKDVATSSSVRERFPQFWEACREVSAVVRERRSMVEQQHRTQEQCRYLQDQCTRLTQEREQLSKEKSEKENQSDTVTRSETQKQFEKLLNQQRQALQMNFDTETKTLRQQLEEMRRNAQDRESEVTQLRAQLGDFMKSRQK
jgi:hypothetical protein